MPETLVSHVAALLVGTPKPFRGTETSSMARSTATGPVYLDTLGFAGDAVADPVNHGGPDKAVHLYPNDHYHWWRDRLDGHELLDRPGAFGENLSIEGLTEDRVHIGDRFRIGEAVVEISHGRAPCWKLDHHFGRRDIVKSVVESGRSGFYLRVIEAGPVTAGDPVERIATGDTDWTVVRAFALLIRGEAKRDPGAARALADHPALAEEWKERARGFAER